MRVFLFSSSTNVEADSLPRRRTRYFPDYRNYLPVDADEEPFCNNIAITAEDVSPTVEKVRSLLPSPQPLADSLAHSSPS